MISSLRKARDFLPEFLSRLTIRRDSGPIDGVDSFCRFVSTRSAFIAQKTLYGYLKARMGTRYPSMFEDDVMVASINIAKMQIFAACLSDMTLFAVSQALPAGQGDDATRRALASDCYRRGLADNAEQAREIEAFSAEDAIAAFERRLAFRDWDTGPSGRDIFTESQSALYRWAPIAPELKQYDQEIVENSIRFAWQEVRIRFAKRLDGPGVAADAADRYQQPPRS